MPRSSNNRNPLLGYETIVDRNGTNEDMLAALARIVAEGAGGLARGGRTFQAP